MLRLKCPTQNYAWGRKGSADCEVAALAAAEGLSIHPDQPYAELWMGTHTNGPARLADDQSILLKDWLDQHLSALGDTVVSQFSRDLPFLFKVLSVETALSIQSHPDKALAEQLHARSPQVYKDDNHKPEMAVAVSNFEALCGFIDSQELARVLAEYPEVHPCLGGQNIGEVASTSGRDEQNEELKRMFTALMTCDETKVSTAISMLQKRLETQDRSRLTAKDVLLLRLNQQYPQDVGVLAALFLNLLTLRKGQAIYLGANVPHAYISGQIVECMATSDNVIRAGLTPKLRDTEVLCQSLIYTQGLPHILEGEEIQQYTSVYTPPFDEFEVFKVDMPASASTLLPASQGPAIMLVQAGHGHATAAPSLVDSLLDTCPKLCKGRIFFVPAQTSLCLTAGEQGLLVWLAGVNAKVFGNKFALPNAKGGVQEAVGSISA